MCIQTWARQQLAAAQAKAEQRLNPDRWLLGGSSLPFVSTAWDCFEVALKSLGNCTLEAAQQGLASAAHSVAACPGTARSAAVLCSRLAKHQASTLLLVEGQPPGPFSQRSEVEGGFALLQPFATLIPLPRQLRRQSMPLQCKAACAAPPASNFSSQILLSVSSHCGCSRFPGAAAEARSAAVWGCPKCRTEYPGSAIPSGYHCFCGKATDPPFDPWNAPHRRAHCTV